MRRLAVLCLVLAFWTLPGAGAWAQEEVAEPDVATDETEPDLIPAVTSESGVWWVELYGYIRAALELVQNDPNYDFVGENNGFVLHNARLGFAGGQSDWGLSWAISIDGAADVRENLNIPDGELKVRLRDAYVREDPVPWVGIQVGQSKVPFSAEEIRSTGGLAFASRAVGLEGVRVGRGFEQPGIFIDRQLGLMLSPREPFYVGDVGFAYYLMIANGNGADELLNDNNQLAYYARLELYYAELVRLGGSLLFNERTEGELPNRFDEDDFGWSIDLLVTWEGLEVFGQYTTLTTEFPTTGSPDQEQVAWHAQAVYLFDFEPMPLFGPSYRIASFDPRAEGGTDDAGVSLEQYQLLYHTIGLNVVARGFPVTGILNYTITGEKEPRELENNRFEALVQLVF